MNSPYLNCLIIYVADTIQKYFRILDIYKGGITISENIAFDNVL